MQEKDDVKATIINCKKRCLNLVICSFNLQNVSTATIVKADIFFFRMDTTERLKVGKSSSHSNKKCRNTTEFSTLLKDI